MRHPGVTVPPMTDAPQGRDISELGQTWTEICAYGTAASIVPA